MQQIWIEVKKVMANDPRIATALRHSQVFDVKKTGP